MCARRPVPRRRRPLRPHRLRPGLLPGVVLALAALSLGACSSTELPFDWRAPRVASEPEVTTTDFRHDVGFTAGRSALAPAGEVALQQFIAEVGNEPNDRVYVLAAAAEVGGLPDDALLARQRQAAVIRSLAGFGVAAEPMRSRPEELSPVQPVAVLVRRTVVTLPECPNWTGRPEVNADNQPLRAWSCTTAVNLGMMVADPNDLAYGRRPGGASGEYLARSIDSYRKGRTRDLIRDTASGEMFPSAAPPASPTGNGN